MVADGKSIDEAEELQADLADEAHEAGTGDAGEVEHLTELLAVGGGARQGRLEAGLVGEGEALVFRAGELVRGRWRKAAFDAPTELLLQASGERTTPIALVPGQTFVQVVPTGTAISVGLAPVL